MSEFKCRSSDGSELNVNIEGDRGLISFATNRACEIPDVYVLLDVGDAINLADELDGFSGITYEDRQNKLRQRVIQWARERDLLNPENAFRQLAKLSSEFGELSDAMLEGDQLKIEDALGDIQVVMTILRHQLDCSGLDDCLEGALNIIEKRTGKTVNGTFIKDK